MNKIGNRVPWWHGLLARALKQAGSLFYHFLHYRFRSSNLISEHFPVHYPLMLLLVRTGTRIGEALALQWGDLNFQGRFADMRRTLRSGRPAGHSRNSNHPQPIRNHLY